MSRTISFLAFNADFNTQLAFIHADESLFRVFVFISDSKENILSGLNGLAFEFGSDLTAFKRDFSYWDIYILKFLSTFHQNLISKNVLFLLL